MHLIQVATLCCGEELHHLQPVVRLRLNLNQMHTQLLTFLGGFG